MLIDEFVNAASVGVIDFAFLGVQQGDVAFCRVAEPEHSKILVDGQCLFAQNLRKLSAGDAPKEIHLPEPVLRHDIPLGFTRSPSNATDGASHTSVPRPWKISQKPKGMSWRRTGSGRWISLGASPADSFRRFWAKRH